MCPISGHRNDGERTNCCSGRLIIDPNQLARYRALLPTKLRGATIEYSLCPASVRKIFESGTTQPIDAADILYVVVVPQTPLVAGHSASNTTTGWQCLKCFGWHKGNRPIDREYRCRNCGRYHFTSSDPSNTLLRQATNYLPNNATLQGDDQLRHYIVFGNPKESELRLQFDVGATIRIPGRPEVVNTMMLCRVLTKRQPYWGRFFEAVLGPGSTKDPSQAESAASSLKRINEDLERQTSGTPPQVCVFGTTVPGFAVVGQALRSSSLMYARPHNYLAWLAEMTIVLYGDFRSSDAPSVQRATHWVTCDEGGDGGAVHDVGLADWISMLRHEISRVAELAQQRCKQEIHGTAPDRLKQYESILRSVEQKIFG